MDSIDEATTEVPGLPEPVPLNDTTSLNDQQLCDKLDWPQKRPNRRIAKRSRRLEERTRSHALQSMAKQAHLPLRPGPKRMDPLTGKIRMPDKHPGRVGKLKPIEVETTAGEYRRFLLGHVNVAWDAAWQDPVLVQWKSVTETAEILGCGPLTVTGYIRKGHLVALTLPQGSQSERRVAAWSIFAFHDARCQGQPLPAYTSNLP